MKNIFKSKLLLVFTVSSVLLPVYVLAAITQTSPSTGQTLSTVISTILDILNKALVLLIAVALVMFVYNVIKYYVKADADRAQAGQYVMYSILGFFIILSFWGLVSVLQKTFNLDSGNGQLQSWSSITSLFPNK